MSSGNNPGYLDNRPVGDEIDKLNRKAYCIGTGAANANSTPEQLKALLDARVIGQDLAKVVMAIAVYQHFRRTKYGPTSSVRIDKANLLMIGPTGCGKTELARTLAAILGLPFAMATATSITQSGYVGEDVESVIVKLLQAADWDVEKAQRGIVYIDEIDKTAVKQMSANSGRTKDPAGEGVQQCLLPLIEGIVARIPTKDRKNNPGSSETIPFDTRNVLFICGGAFVGLDEIIMARQPEFEGSIGIGRPVRARDEVLTLEERNHLLSLATPEDLQKFGMLPELIGRLPVIAHVNSLSEEDLARILFEPEQSILEQQQRLLEISGAVVKFTKGAIYAIAAAAYKLGTGGRALRSIVERTLLPTFFRLPAGITVITEQDVIDREKNALKLLGSASAKLQPLPDFIVNDNAVGTLIAKAAE